MSKQGAAKARVRRPSAARSRSTPPGVGDASPPGRLSGAEPVQHVQTQTRARAAPPSRTRPKRESGVRASAAAVDPENAPPQNRAQSPDPVVPPGGAVDPSTADADSAIGVTEQGDASVHSRYAQTRQTLGRLLKDVDSISSDPQSRRKAAEAINRIAAQLGAQESQLPPKKTGGLRGVLSVDRAARYLSRRAMRTRSDEVDAFGRDATYEAHVRPLLDTLYDRYFRCRAEGLSNIPGTGRAMLVCNRGGLLPVDGLMLHLAVERNLPQRSVRWLIEDFNFHAPFLGPFLNRLGAVRACPENAERLLTQETLVAVFPEGIKGVSKRFEQRYQVKRFGRGGYVRIALRTGTPLVPVAVVGAEDAYPLLYRLGFLKKGPGVPFFPITPTFPLLGPVGLVPLPSRFVILVGKPIEGLDQYGPDAAEDVVVVDEINQRVRTTVQALVDEARELRGAQVYR